MPGFQTPTAIGLKRKTDAQDSAARKRVETDAFNKNEEYWVVQWRVPQTRKHKTWDEDGVLVVVGSSATLYDTSNRVIGMGRPELPLVEGCSFFIGGGSKELELDRRITRQDFLSGACFGNASTFASSGSGCKSSGIAPTSAQKMSSISCSSRSAAKKYVTPTMRRPPEPRATVPLQPVNLILNTDAPKSSPGSSQSKDRDVETSEELEDSLWTVNWRKPQTKTKKTWDGDAYVSRVKEKITMVSETGKILDTTFCKDPILFSGYTTYVGGKEVQLDNKTTPEQLPAAVQEVLNLDVDMSISSIKSGPEAVKEEDGSRYVPPVSFYGTAPKKPPGPLHDPGAPGTVVMAAPTTEHVRRFNKRDLPVVPVVLDPFLSRKLRPHQVEGVKFLYECVMGLRKHEGQGCILADEMGLGKTLQTICLVWTLLKQNPYAGSGPVVQKVLIVCPVSLINNWRDEFHKWLGRDRVGVITCDKDSKATKTFIHGGRHQHVLIIGYERLRTVIDDLSACIPPIGLIICDEGHRLKTANNKTNTMFQALRTRRRIILSGTPIQNDLGEFHAMVSSTYPHKADFCNPQLLDDYNTFKRVYETPILKGRAPDSTDKEHELGEARCAQLLKIAQSFVLRRDATLLKKYLPPKHEYVVFIRPTALQLSIFTKILHSDKVDDVVRGSTAESLALINILTKVSNSPILLKAAVDKANSANSSSSIVKRAGIEDAASLIPSNARIEDMALSGTTPLLSLCIRFHQSTTEEKCAVVSHYTSTLNILEAYCKKKRYSYHRLDGQTPPPKRQEYVKQFNPDMPWLLVIFLLSSKAGGVGINLIGASRLVLFDCDWNPSFDLQSAARCHRDGQKRTVYIYKFLTAGTIDEKIYQRQVTKLGLSNSKSCSRCSWILADDSFTRNDLRDIFRIHPDTSCNTHELLGCPCEAFEPSQEGIGHSSADQDSDISDEEQRGFVNAAQVKMSRIQKMDRAYLQKKKAALAALGQWKHINCLSSKPMDLADEILQQMAQRGDQAQGNSEQSRLEKLLSVNLEIVEAMSNPRALPGGTISFIFEKLNSTHIEEGSVSELDD
ncbi:hypothetical protein FISHEDRAFT_44019 [Fistulina hepatica ATCC 64428]|uniref:DNA repair and recombination protein RAD54B n=1 Tax=Fistulina hepatica ATCC 64428 TaxID=1128425 RepID=A0A0D7AB34_9AGAR|nr:hypothetical protein FISHEDRAFT_44019 [Fistulina hepatica ATCC 64428]